MKAKSVLFNLNDDDSLFNKLITRLQLKEHSIEVGKVNTPIFKDGETCPHFRTSVRGKRAYILISPNTPLKIIQLMLAMDALKRASAAEIIPIIPYFPYARQDKRDQRRGPIGARVMAEMIEERGATSVITLDLHSDQIEGFFNIPVIHLRGKYLFHDYISDTSDENTVLCSPDAGGLKRVKKIRDLIYKRNESMKLQYVSIDKTRSEANNVDNMEVLGDVDGKDVLVIDDMCDTGNTLIKGANALIEAGAHSVSVLITHGVMSYDDEARTSAYEKIKNSTIKKFICSDSLEQKHVTIYMGDKMGVITVANELANAIININLDGSIHR
jgi:ribose-phosphate pyrophosphokinase